MIDFMLHMWPVVPVLAGAVIGTLIGMFTK